MVHNSCCITGISYTKSLYAIGFEKSGNFRLIFSVEPLKHLPFPMYMYLYTFCKLQTFITWPQVVRFYRFKVYFEAFIELNFVLHITKRNDFLYTLLS